LDDVIGRNSCLSSLLVLLRVIITGEDIAAVIEALVLIAPMELSMVWIQILWALLGWEVTVERDILYQEGQDQIDSCLGLGLLVAQQRRMASSEALEFSLGRVLWRVGRLQLYLKVITRIHTIRISKIHKGRKKSEVAVLLSKSSRKKAAVDPEEEKGHHARPAGRDGTPNGQVLMQEAMEEAE
jgi:hypothetical protein